MRPIVWVSGMILALSMLLSVATKTSADLIKPVELMDTQFVLTGCIDDTALGAAALTPAFASANWVVNALQGTLNGVGVNNDIRVDVQHSQAPHGLPEVAPNPDPAFLTATIFDVILGGAAGPVIAQVGHGTHIDTLQIRYDPLVAGVSQLSIRVEHSTSTISLLEPLNCVALRITKTDAGITMTDGTTGEPVDSKNVPPGGVVKISNEKTTGNLEVTVTHEGRVTFERTLMPGDNVSRTVGSDDIPEGAEFEVCGGSFISIADTGVITVETVFTLVPLETCLPVGGTTSFLVTSSNSSTKIGVSLAAGVLATLVSGAWYARRRWLRK